MATQETNDANLDTKSGGANVGTVLLALADRCEREEPNRLLDAHIAFAVGIIDYLVGQNVIDAADEYGGGSVLPYTSSLDAAVTLVPEGHGWTIRDLPRAMPVASVWRGWLGEQENATAKTPALALCTAALRAHAAVAEDA